MGIAFLGSQQAWQDIGPVQVDTVLAFFALVGITTSVLNAFHLFQEPGPVFVQSQLPHQWSQHRQVEKADIPGTDSLVAHGVERSCVYSPSSTPAELIAKSVPHM